MHDIASPAAPAITQEAGLVAYVQGLTALRDGNAAAAIAPLEQAQRQLPTHPGRRRHLIHALLAQGAFARVAELAEVGLRQTPTDPDLHFAAGSAQSALGNPARARTAFARALSLRPNHAPSWLNMGNACVDLDDLASAEAFCRTAIRQDPDLPEAHASLGFVLTRQGRLAEAIVACDTAIRLRPGFPQAAWNRAVALLLSGDLRAGFAAYESRKTHPAFSPDFPRLLGPEWTGDDPSGCRILVRAEQGAGDTIQFARYLPLIQAAGGIPILACAADLVPLVRRLPGVCATPISDPLPGYDAWVDQISLPRLFGTELHRIPSPGRFLSADPDRVQAWRDRLPPGLRIGLTCSGNPKHSNERLRAVPPPLLAPLLTTPGATFVNLQHGPSAAYLPLPDLTPLRPNFAETAALVEALDLVITVDTSIAHLSGALGKPTWVLLPHAPDWRWLLDRRDSPWYGTVRLYRQPGPGDWRNVIQHVSRDLQAFVAETPL